jgi:hypothetical protein
MKIKGLMMVRTPGVHFDFILPARMDASIGT